jgi:RimJ/RimL family protein N-acetyltransferase
VTEAADALVLLTDPEVDLWNPAPEVTDLASAAAWCRRGADWTSGHHATFSIYAGGSFAGNVSVHNIDDEHGNADLGYRVMAAHRGRGVATWAVREATAYAFEDLRLFRVQLFHAVANVASCRVAEKAGFTFEATLRSAGVYAGVRHDEHVHARLRTDPPPPAPAPQRAS